ncbi:serine/threonine-protein kinase [Candidatus Uabimicrobium amorphum]|uniref:non-specific serine/threonine protein kinase n=1 Tax=Uabimicrobium amorphum TaxID=2596890 RepID=A0A5S9F1C9_UABAM|nr:serine/threonine-protein kinase [Candidatus Uabimicrobium amorphum]BBM82535.1 protein kinase [Candidatus Uabimicrobium amorphum]
MSTSQHKVIGNYQIMSILGQGGMGKVYKAWDPNLKRVVALKTILPNQMNESAVSRFYREATAVSKLHHPSIVQIHTIGEENGVHYFTMDYIEGSPLDEYVAERKLIPNKIAGLMRKIAKGIHYAHSQGVIHRDLKPDNILVDNSGNPHIMDFGLAKIDSGGYDLTKTGDTLGTPFYMSPEQAEGLHKEVDERSDIFALGAILYRLLTGQFAFHAQSFISLVQKILREDPVPPRQINKKIPQSLENVCLVALSKDKAHRYPSANAFADDLGRSLRNRPVATKVRKPQNNVAILAVVACFSVIVMMTVIWNLLRDKNPVELQNLETSVSKSQKIYIEASENIAQQDYLKAIKLLHEYQKVSKKTGDDINEKLFLCYAKTQQYELARKLYESLQERSSSTKFTMSQLLAGQNRNAQALLLLDEVIHKANDEIANEALLYKGSIYLKNKSYRKALDCFQRKPQVANIPIVLFYQGICSFHLDDYQRAKQFFTKASPYIEDDPQLLHYQAQILLHEEKYSEALTKIQQAIDLAPGHDEYYIVRGKIQQKLNLFVAAKTSFIKALKLNALNVNAIGNFMDFAVKQPEIENDYFWTISYYVGQLARTERPDVFRGDFKKLLANYSQDYVQWRTAQQRNNGDPQVFIKILQTSTRPQIYSQALSGLLSLRYHPQCEIILQDAIDKNSQNEQLQKVFNILREKKIQEQKRIVSYYIIDFYLNQNASALIALQKKQTLIAELLHDGTQILHLRYAAANALAHLGKFSSLEKLAQHTDPQLAIIARCVLRDCGHFIPIAVPEIIDQINSKFLTARICHAMNYPLANKLDPRDTSYRIHTHYLQKWLTHSDPAIQIYAAANLSRIAYIIDTAQRSNLRQQVRNILQKFMAHKIPEFRSCAHHYFWHTTSFNEFERDKYLYIRALNDTHDDVVSTVLFFSYRFNMNLVADPLIQLIRRTDNLRLKLPAIYALAIGNSDHPFLQELLHDTQNSFFVRATVVVFTGYTRLLKLTRNPATAFRQLPKDMAAAKKQIEVMSKDPQESLRIFIYYCNSFVFNNSPLYLIDQETDNVRAHLILNSVGGYQNQMLSLIQKPQSSISERRNMAKKYIKSTNDKVKENAVAAYLTLSTRAQRKKIMHKCLNSSEPLRKGAAQGFYNLIYLDILKKYPIYQALDRVLPDTRYRTYLSYLRQALPTDREKYLRFLSNAIKLSPQSKYLYERAILYRLQNKLVLAEQDLQQAIQQTPQNSLYLLELIEIYVDTHKPTLAKQKLQELEKRDLDNAINLRMGKIYWNLREGKKAKHFFYKCLVNNKETYHMIAYLDTIIANVEIARIFAAENDVKSAVKYLQYYDSIYRRIYNVSLRDHRLLTKTMIMQYPELRAVLHQDWVKNLKR